jgi:3-oxoacyl-[acyl-carrier protein] reductase
MVSDADTSLAPAAERFANRVILVTGGGSGIGRATSLRLAREGAAVIVADIREKNAGEVAELITNAGGRASASECDVAIADDVERVVRRENTFGPIDGLVACAGISFRNATDAISLQDWNRVVDVNLTGTFLAIRSVLPTMIEMGRGTIVTIGSTASVVGSGGSSAYGAAKAGVLGLTRFVGIEYADVGIRANCLCPGKVETEFARHSGELMRSARSESRPGNRIGVSAPMQRMAHPDEVANVVAFLSSNDSSWMTASAVMVDGGYTAV